MNEAPEINSKETKECPVCGESIKAKAIKCRFCGEDLEAFALKRTNVEERNLFIGHAALLLSLGDYVISILFIGIPIFIFWLRKMCTKYIITTQRIKIERGLLSKSRNNIELFRIDDYEVKKPIGMRIVGHSILLLKSSDRSLPDIEIKGIPKLEQLAEELRECGLRERHRRGIKVWANA